MDGGMRTTWGPLMIRTLPRVGGTGSPDGVDPEPVGHIPQGLQVLVLRFLVGVHSADDGEECKLLFCFLTWTLPEDLSTGPVL